MIKNPDGKIGIFEVFEKEKGSPLTDEEIDNILEKIDLEKNDEDFYVDAFGNQISFAGIRTIKKENTVIKISDIQKNEIIKCANDYEYFRKFYCKIITKNGIGRPEPREYQKRLEKKLLTNKDTVILYGRQSGKCQEKSTLINVKKDNIKMRLAVEVFHKIDEIEKFSKMMPRKNKITFEKYINRKIFNDVKNLITEDKKQKITELLELYNNVQFQFKDIWVKNFIKYNVEENYAFRILEILKYNNFFKKQNRQIPSTSKEKLILLYGEKEGLKRYNEKIEKMKGKNNPAYNHGGKYSVYSKKFIHGYDENKIKIAAEKNSKAQKENGNNQVFLEYWLKRGYSEQEAKEKLIERQSTFSLEKCIQKYGKEEGIKVFQERQNKWQNTLNSKSQEEIDRINQLRGTGRMNQLFNRNPEIKKVPGILYYVRFFNEEIEFWKIGITSRTINERFGNSKKIKTKYNLNMEIIFEDNNLTFYEAFKKEQEILKKYKKYRINIDYNGFKTTEAFEKDIFKNRNKDEII